ncbi:hypothetical protein J6590_070797 [Homalodisca vitripennis]|nr:hypothetical protein J6590_070797 [Homalodisca vitripennis]
MLLAFSKKSLIEERGLARDHDLPENIPSKARLENKHHSLESEAKSTKSCLREAQIRIQDLESCLEEKNALVHGYESQIRELTQQVAKLERKLNSRSRAENASRDLSRELETQKHCMAQQIDQVTCQNRQLEEEVCQLRSEMDHLREQLGQERKNSATLENVLANSRQETLQRAKDNNELKAQVQCLQTKLTDLQDKLCPYLLYYICGCHCLCQYHICSDNTVPPPGYRGKAKSAFISLAKTHLHEAFSKGAKSCPTPIKVSFPLFPIFYKKPSRDHFWLVYTYQWNLPLGTAKADMFLKSGQPYECARSGTSLTGNVEILGCKGQFDRSLLASTSVCHSLPALTEEAGSELASPSSGRRPLLPNLTPEYPVTPEAVLRLKPSYCPNREHGSEALRRCQGECAEYQVQVSDLKREVTNQRFERARMEQAGRLSTGARQNTRRGGRGSHMTGPTIFSLIAFVLWLCQD